MTIFFANIVFNFVFEHKNNTCPFSVNVLYKFDVRKLLGQTAFGSYPIRTQILYNKFYKKDTNFLQELSIYQFQEVKSCLIQTHLLQCR
nr:MAG TPA: hypothetical protein [Caudoviricetes sp.]DAZ75547.1 MAG TPA: hypothetical protein [Caudoviricetes sp.]